MTPCEKRGYKLGQVFEVVPEYRSGMYGKPGDLCVLCYDDGTDAPKFHFLTGERKGEEWYKGIDTGGCKEVKRIYPPEVEKPANVTITVDGKDTVISRESAIALNLIEE